MAKWIAKETAQRIAEVWPESNSVLDAMRRAGLSVTDVRTAYAYRRQAEEILGVTLPTLNPKHAGHWTLRESRDLPNRVILDHPFTMVVFSDAHFWPGQTSPAFWILLQILEELQPDFIIDNGDSWDGASISRHPRMEFSHVPTLREELDCVRDHLDLILDAAGKDATALRHQGNHDARFLALLAQRVPELEKMPGTTFEELFPKWEHHVSTIFNDCLFVKHRFRSGVHGAYNNTLHTGLSTVTGHTHKLGVRPLTDMRGTRYGIETGTLADCWGPQFRYAEQNVRDWRMGFAVITIDGQRVIPELVEVSEDGKAWFRGKVYVSD